MDVRRFMGLASFFTKFVPQFAVIAKSLNNILKKEVKFIWDDTCQLAFNTLIDKLVKPPVLAIYDVEKEHQLHTDASSCGLAAILLQLEETMWKPVAYYSRACTEAESKYHAYELEVLAVVAACERFKMYLMGKRFTVVTDCKAVSSLRDHKPAIPRIARWFLKLMEYDHSIIHRPGDSMRNVDALSRAPVTIDEEVEDISSRIMEIRMNDWVSSLQCQDENVRNLIEVIKGVKDSQHKKQIMNDYCLKNHRLFRKWKGESLLVIPKGMRWRITKLCHDDVGHPALENTCKRILQNFWFPRLRNFIKGYIKSCIDCAYHREPTRSKCELYGMEVPSLPFQVLHLDHLGPFIKSRMGYEHILVVVDALTRYTIIAPVKSTKSKPVIDVLNNLTMYFGLPQQLVTDRGTAFTSATFEEFCNENNIQHVKVAVRTPRSNGLAERVNQSVLSYLKTSSNTQRDWDRQIRMLQWSMNTRPNSTTKMSPIELIYDFPMRDLSGNKMLTALHDDVHITMNKRRDKATVNIQKAREQWKKRFDAKHSTPILYREGDLVLMESPAPATGESKKLQPKYKGPYVITKTLRYDRYVIEDIDGVQRTNRRYHAVVSSDKMKPWGILLPEADDMDLPNDDDYLTRDE